MNADEVKTTDRMRGVIDIALKAVPERRRDAETVDPVTDRRAPTLLQRARERLDWTRVPGLRPSAPKSTNIAANLLRKIGLFVLLPTALVGVYFYVFASDQYIAEAQFAVRGNLEPMEEAPSGQFANLIQKHNSQDSFIVRDYIESQAIVSKLEASIGVSKMFSTRAADFWTRYDASQPVEELVEYWRKHVNARIDVISGVITLSVRAFTPQDALTISKAVIGLTETLVNDISVRAQNDMLVNAERDATRAQDRLRKAHLALQTFRNRWGIIDPIKTAEATLQTLGSLKKDRFKFESDLQVLRGSSLDEKSRSIQTLVANIAAIDQQIKRLQEQLTSDGLSGSDASNNMTRALLEYEGLQVEKVIAGKLNESANLMLDKARVSAGRQQIYLATFVPPALPVDSLYPERGYSLIVTLFCFMVLWSSISLVVSGIKDQRL